jgi:hypothetical protein
LRFENYPIILIQFLIILTAHTQSATPNSHEKIRNADFSLIENLLLRRIVFLSVTSLAELIMSNNSNNNPQPVQLPPPPPPNTPYYNTPTASPSRLNPVTLFNALNSITNNPNSNSGPSGTAPEHLEDNSDTSTDKGEK